uniref:tRNA (guanine(9)-N(1))-methyltransferase n=1 Tax=Cyprinus carpio carpio TaxID=630221 RepID=A0A8C1H0R3_CYPCA
RNGEETLGETRLCWEYVYLADVNEPQLCKHILEATTKERLEEARGAGLCLCFYVLISFFFSQEIFRLACQTRRLYGYNKNSLTADSLLYKECVRMNDGYLNYFWFNLFPSEDVIYLTPDATLEYVEEDKVYILEGLVKKISYKRAKELVFLTARLLIDEYMVKQPNPKNFHSKILCVSLFEILLTFRDNKDWTIALAAGIPPGKGYIVMSLSPGWFLHKPSKY